MKKIKLFQTIILFTAVLTFIGYWWIKENLNILSNPEYPMCTQIGSVDSANHQIIGDQTKQGFLAYGPYTHLSEGNYIVKFQLKLINPGGTDLNRKIAYCDVHIVNHTTEKNRVIKELFWGDFKRKNTQIVTLKFSVPEGNPPCEFRVFSFAGNTLILEALELWPINPYQLARILNGKLINNIFILLVALFTLAGAAYIRKHLQKPDSKEIKQESIETEKINKSIPFTFLLQFTVVAFFTLLIINAYIFDKAGIPIVRGTVLLFVIMELFIFWLIRKKKKMELPKIQYDFWDTILFLLVFCFIGYVLLKPSLPTLMPPNFSNDCVSQYTVIEHIYKHNMLAGHPMSQYPFGYRLITAILAKYTGLPAVKLMHILVVFSVALTTAITHALIVRIFNLRKDAKIMALLPVFTLFWVRGYYELSFNAFFHVPQIFSFLFVMSFFWALVEYENHQNWFIYIALNLSAIGLIYTYTSYIPILIIPFFLTALITKSETNFVTRLKNMAIVILPSAVLTIIYFISSRTSKVGTAILNHEGYCIPFRFLNFGDFGENRSGEIFLILSLIGIPITFYALRKKLALFSFTFGFLFYFGVFFVLKHYFGKYSYYQAYKILYLSPYIGVIYIAAIVYLIREQFVKTFKPIINTTIHKGLFIFWTLFAIWFMATIYKLEDYKPNYPEKLREPVYMSIDWARKNLKEKFQFIYHHPNIGNWMRQGFMEERFNHTYYTQVFLSPVPTLEDWLENAQKGEVAVVDDLYSPPLNDNQEKLFEVLFQKEYSAVIRKR